MGPLGPKSRACALSGARAGPPTSARAEAGRPEPRDPHAAGAAGGGGPAAPAPGAGGGSAASNSA